MSLKFNCPQCGQSIVVGYVGVGEEVKCRHCGKRSEVPDDAIESDEKPTYTKAAEGRCATQLADQSFAESLAALDAVKWTRWVVEVVWYVALLVCLIAVVEVLPLWGSEDEGHVRDLRCHVRYRAAVEHYGMPQAAAGNLVVLVGSGTEYPVESECDSLHPAPSSCGTMMTGHDNALIFYPESTASLGERLEHLLIPGWVFLVVHFLRRFFRSIHKGQLFASENAWHLRWIGLAILLAGPLYGSYKFFEATILMCEIDIPGASVLVPWSWYPELIFVGFVILAVAQVFAAGAKMQRELDLTI